MAKEIKRHQHYKSEPDPSASTFKLDPDVKDEVTQPETDETTNTPESGKAAVSSSPSAKRIPKKKPQPVEESSTIFHRPKEGGIALGETVKMQFDELSDEDTEQLD